MGQCTSPQLNACHRLFDQDGHQDSSSASLQSRPCSLWLLVIPLGQRLSLWDNWGDERSCDESHWHAQTRRLPWILPEVVGTVLVHCGRRLLRREQEFHVCIINKSAHIKKSLETFLMILVYTVENLSSIVFKGMSFISLSWSNMLMTWQYRLNLPLITYNFLALLQIAVESHLTRKKNIFVLPLESMMD